MKRETLSLRIDFATKQRFDARAKQTNRSKSFLAAEAISAYVHREEWLLREIHAGIAGADAGRVISHDKMKKWMGSWGTSGETKAPL